MAQLVYLPENGKPIALCILGTEKDDEAPVFGQSEGMNYFDWRAEGLAYILIGFTEKDTLNTLAQDAYQQTI